MPLKNDRGVYFSFQNLFFEKGIRMLKFEKMFHKHNESWTLKYKDAFEIGRAYYQAEQKIGCPFCSMSRRRLVEKSIYLNLPNDETGKTILHGCPFIENVLSEDWLLNNEFSHAITLLIAEKDYGFALYRELIRNGIYVERLSLEKVHRCPKCYRRLD